jgi:hypothetical protein
MPERATNRAIREGSKQRCRPEAHEDFPLTTDNWLLATAFWTRILLHVIAAEAGIHCPSTAKDANHAKRPPLAKLALDRIEGRGERREDTLLTTKNEQTNNRFSPQIAPISADFSYQPAPPHSPICRFTLQTSHLTPVAVFGFHTNEHCHKPLRHMDLCRLPCLRSRRHAPCTQTQNRERREPRQKPLTTKGTKGTKISHEQRTTAFHPQISPISADFNRELTTGN